MGKFKPKRWINWLLNLVFVLAIGWGVSAWQLKDLLPASGQVRAPDFELVGLDGKIYRLADSQAKTTIIYFFAPWCPICRLSIGNLEKLRQVQYSKELSIFLIALSWQDLAEVKQFVADHSLTLPVLLGTPEIAETYRIKGFPTYYVLNAEGKIVNRSVGYSTELGLRWKI